MRSGKQATVKPVGGSSPRLHEPLDLRVGEVGLVGRPEDARLVALERLGGLQVRAGASQPQASMPITRTPRSYSQCVASAVTPGPRAM